MKLVSRMKSFFPFRLLFPQRPLFRDRKPPTETPEVPVVRHVGVLAGGVVLAGFVLMTLAAFRDDAAQADLQAVATDHTTTAMPSTDGRAVPETEAQSAMEKDRLPDVIVTRIDRNCAAHAREKLMVGLTNYYLQRQLRPGADSDDVADTSSVTALLTGPGDPAAMTPGTSCQG
jgi:hypothetical protein